MNCYFCSMQSLTMGNKYNLLATMKIKRQFITMRNVIGQLSIIFVVMIFVSCLKFPISDARCYCECRLQE